MSASFPPTSYKVALLLKRSAVVESEKFAERLRYASPLSPPQGLIFHALNMLISDDVPIEHIHAASFDAVEEFIFERADQARDWLLSTDFAHWLQCRSALLANRPSVITGTAFTAWQQDVDRSDAVKIITLPVRRAGTTTAAFAHHWVEVHVGLALEGPGTPERLVCLQMTPSSADAWPGIDLAPYDGIGVIMFISPQHLAEEFSGPHYRNVMAPDEPRFADPEKSRALMVREMTF